MNYHTGPPQHNPAARCRDWRLTAGAVLVGIAVMILLGACGTTKPIVLAGRIIRRDLVKEERRRKLLVTAVDSKSGTLRLRFAKFDVITSVHVPQHQKLLRYADPQEMRPKWIRDEPVPNETIPGKPETNTRTVNVGVLAGETLQINGHSVSTDAQGIYTDDEYLLGLFDDLRHPTLTLAVSHKSVADFECELSRDRMLESLGVPMKLDGKRRVEHANVLYHVSLPETVTPGARFTVDVEAENKGEGFVGAVMARTFSRHDWLDGKTFYIGHLEPGRKRTFSRRFTCPFRQPTETVFAMLGVTNALGAAPKHCRPLSLRVVAKPDR